MARADYDRHEQPQPTKAFRATMNLKLSELFESIQGEGASAGEPCLFVRLSQCNLHCVWCDTRYTWDWRAYRFEDEVRIEPVEQVAERVLASARDRIVVTGGEPLLQQPALAELLRRVDAVGPRRLVEVETNGTLAPLPDLARRVDQWNVSPKLANGGDPERLRLRPEALTALLATGRAYLKLVVEDDADGAEAEALVRDLGWPRERVLLMAQADAPGPLGQRGPLVARAAARLGFGYSPRLHVERWGGARGR